MQVHFIHPGHSHLPELEAYAAHLRPWGHEACTHQNASTVPADARVVWWMCGRVRTMDHQRFAQAFQVHEYASASVPPFAWAKDRIKRWTQPKPDYRLFQNKWVRQRLGFADDVPWEFREMGVSSTFLTQPQPEDAAVFDMVYLGDMVRLRHFLPVFEGLEQAGMRTLLIGSMPTPLQRKFRAFKHITVTGKVPHHEVPAQLRRARCALNLVPDQIPYSEQTSTKLLEYCAIGLPVISTDYRWVRNFAASNPAAIAYLPAQASASAYADFFRKTRDMASGPSPDMGGWAWPHTLARLNIWKAAGLAP
uniref:glycosyltransferase n=1 Tax=uncultured Acidovorax sp. TaxID=158751 RepID=UPI0030FC6883